MKKRILILLIAFSAVFVMACSADGANDEPNDSPDDDSTFVEYGVAGTIEEIESGENQKSIRIHVVGDENNGATYDNAWVTVTEDTVVYADEETNYEVLETGDYVNVFFTGDVAESYPVQATAKQINIIEE